MNPALAADSSGYDDVHPLARQVAGGLAVHVLGIVGYRAALD